MVPEPSARAELLRLINGFRASMAISVASRLAIADHLRDGPRTVADLAVATETHEPSLYRLLRALAAIGVFEEQEGRRFALTPLAEVLRTDVAESVAGWASWISEESFWRGWGALMHTVRTGENAYEHIQGVDPWTFRREHPEVNDRFNAAMTSLSSGAIDAVVAAYDFSRFACIVDVGGGQGALLSGVLRANPGARGILFDQPHVVAAAPPVLEAAGVADRCNVASGSFFDGVPDGGDAYMMRAITHDWPDDACVAILRNCRRVMTREARLLIIDRVIAAPNEGAEGKFSDLNMMAVPGGRERTEEEFRALLDAAGFRLDAIVPAGEAAIIDATPV